MSKRLILILALIAILALVLVGAALINANSLIAKFQPELERGISQVLGSKVSVGQIRAQVFPRTVLQISEIRSAAEERPEEQPLALRNIYLHLRLMPLLKRSLEISKLSIKEPSIVLLKDKGGMRVSGLGKLEPQKQQRPPSPAPPQEKKGAAGPGPAALKLNLQNIQVENASITLKDLDAQTEYKITRLYLDSAVELEGKNIRVSNLKVRATALEKAELEIRAGQATLLGSHFSAEPVVISAHGSSINLRASYDLEAKKGHVTVESPGINLAGFEVLYPPNIRELSLRGGLKPALNINLGPADSFDAKGSMEILDIALKVPKYSISGLKGTMAIKANPQAQVIHTKDLRLKLNNQPVEAAFNGLFDAKRADMENLVLALFGGRLEGSLSVTLTDEKPFGLDLTAKELDLEQALSTLAPDAPQMISGTLKTMQLKTSGSLAKDIPQSLKGTANIQMGPGALKGFNLAGDVLKAVNNIPFLSGALYDAVPAGEKADLDSNDTAIKSLSADLAFAGGIINVNDLKLISSIFSLEAQGKVGFDSSLDLASTIFFDRDFSAKLASKAKELNKLLDADGSLVIPLVLKGRPPKLLVLPNVQKLLQLGAQKAVQDKAADLVEGLLGGKKKGSTGTGLEGLFKGR